MCLLPCLCTLAFYRLLLLVVHTVELLTEVAAADFTGNDHKSFGTQFTIQMLDKIAFALHANCINFYSIYERAGAAEDIMRTLFWLEESNMGRVQLVQTTPSTLPEKHDDRLRAIEDTTFHYNPSDDWPVCPPVTIYFDCIVDSFMREWLVCQQEYRAGEITKEEYFEWKLNWPDTCDDLGKVTPNIQWRKNK